MYTGWCVRAVNEPRWGCSTNGVLAAAALSPEQKPPAVPRAQVAVVAGRGRWEGVVGRR